VCTYPSASPTSNQKDCIVDAGTAFLVINKWTNQASTCTLVNKTGLACPPYNNAETQCTVYQCDNRVSPVRWNFTYTGAGVNTQTHVTGFGWTVLTPLPPQTYSVLEDPVLPAGWIQIGFTCADGQNNPNSVILYAGQTLACYYINYFGNYSQFVAEYGAVNTTKGILGNLTLDTYSANRTNAPTPMGYVPPTPNCPADSNTVLTNMFQICHEPDFYTGATCSSGCLTNVEAVQTKYASWNKDDFVICVNDYNTENGVIYSSAAMDVINTRIASGTPICANGKVVNPPPVDSSAKYATASLSLLALLLFL
jgi:hypothetical protein